MRDIVMKRYVSWWVIRDERKLYVRAGWMKYLGISYRKCCCSSQSDNL